MAYNLRRPRNLRGLPGLPRVDLILPATTLTLKIRRRYRYERQNRQLVSAAHLHASRLGPRGIHTAMNAAETLNREFLEIRAKILEIAAALDRLDRAEGSVAGDPRLARIQQGLVKLQSQQPDRAEQIQLIFSLSYDQDWRETLAVGRTPKRNDARG